MQLKVSGSLLTKRLHRERRPVSCLGFLQLDRVREEQSHLGMGKAAATRGQSHFENPSRPNRAAVPEGFVGEMHSVVTDRQHVGG